MEMFILTLSFTYYLNTAKDKISRLYIYTNIDMIIIVLQRTSRRRFMETKLKHNNNTFSRNSVQPVLWYFIFFSIVFTILQYSTYLIDYFIVAVHTERTCFTQRLTT